ncbi:hypothetical protein [Haloarchaeobius sp. FL176]|uniref:hypothetical protein n=1 Tax=Haloarchaeobius sp. FL176 TaxID=2967129 RepID=UPI0021473D30|nr:hypothetical protein [Haloarchaeobius sp. FL176]
MDEKTLNAVLFAVGSVVVLYSFLRATLLLGVVVLVALFALSLLYRLVTAVERIADNVGELAAATDDGRGGSGRGTAARATSRGDWDEEERPPAEERDPDELFE